MLHWGAQTLLPSRRPEPDKSDFVELDVLLFFVALNLNEDQIDKLVVFLSGCIVLVQGLLKPPQLIGHMGELETGLRYLILHICNHYFLQPGNNFQYIMFLFYVFSLQSLWLFS